MRAGLSWSGLAKCPWALKALLLLGCLLVVPTVSYVLHGHALIADFQKAKVRHEQVQQQWQGLAQGAEIQGALEQVGELEARLEQRRGELFDADGLASLLHSLGLLGVGLSFEQVKVGEARAQPNFLEVPIQLRVSGHYQALQRFLVELAGLERLVTLHALSLVAPGQNTSGELEMELELRAYRAIASRQVPEASLSLSPTLGDPFAVAEPPGKGAALQGQAVLVGNLRDPDRRVALVRVGEVVHSLHEGERLGEERVFAVEEARIELVAPERLGGIVRVVRLGAVIEG